MLFALLKTVTCLKLVMLPVVAIASFFFALFSSTPNSQSNPLFVDKIEKGHHDYTMKDEGLLDYNALGIRCTEIFSWISGDYLLIFNFVFSILLI